MSVHDCLVRSLIGEEESICSKRFPEFGGEDLTEKCPRPQSLNEEDVTMLVNDQLLIIKVLLINIELR
jgi:hypothetical protein